MRKASRPVLALSNSCGATAGTVKPWHRATVYKSNFAIDSNVVTSVTVSDKSHAIHNARASRKHVERRA